MWGQIVSGVMGSVSGSGGSSSAMGGGAHETGAQQGGAILAGGYNAGINFGPSAAAQAQQSYTQWLLIGGVVLIAAFALRGKK